MQGKKIPPEQQDINATPGSYLRRVRKERALSVEEVAGATKISVKNIRAIENAAFEQLPADTFVRGLVAIYGNYLGLDGGKIAADFLAARKKLSSGGRPQNLTLKKVPPSTLAPKKLAEPAHISSATLALALFVLILVSFSGFCLYTSWNPLAFLGSQTDTMQASIQKIFAGLLSETDTQTTPPQEKQAEHTELQPVAESASSEANAKKASYQLNVHFLKQGTVLISIDGETPVPRKFQSGEIIRLQADKEMKLVFNVPGAATLTMNGKPLSFPVAADGASPTLVIPDDLLDQ